MDNQTQPFKMVQVEADLFESVGFVDTTHCLFIKFKGSSTVCYEKVPRFRFQGLLGAAAQGLGDTAGRVGSESG